MISWLTIKVGGVYKIVLDRANSKLQPEPTKSTALITQMVQEATRMVREHYLAEASADDGDFPSTEAS